MKSTLLLLFSGLFSLLGRTQSLYAITNHRDLIRIYTNNCTTEVVLLGSEMEHWVSLTDIAYAEGVLYGISYETLYSIDPVTGQMDTLSSDFFSSSGLAADAGGNLYAGYGGIQRFNVSTSQLETLGSLSPFEISGDLEYINGSLYAVANESTSGQSVLLKIELNPFSYALVGNLPLYSYGIAKSLDLDADHIYVASNGTPSDIYAVNINDASAVITCSDIQLFSDVWGLTSTQNKVSVEENYSENIRISQDPESQTLSILVSNNAQLHCAIYNELGQIVATNDLSDGQTTINTAYFSAGVYLVRVMNENNTAVHQIRIACL